MKNNFMLVLNIIANEQILKKDLVIYSTIYSYHEQELQFRKTI